MADGTSPVPRLVGAIAHSELASDDPQATRAFLESVFSWKFEQVDMPQGQYLAFETANGGRGGIRPTKGTPAGTTNYILVDALDAAQERVEAAGGTIVLDRVDVPGMGSFFWFQVPGGPVLACWEDA